MSDPTGSPTSSTSGGSRRDVLKSAAFAGSAALASPILSAAYAAEDNTVRLALIGSGPRGTGAVGNALSTSGGPVELYAMADIDQSRIDIAHKALTNRFPSQINVPADRQFIGFDAYRQAVDSLAPGDIALCTTRAYCRPQHVEYAVRRGVNVFMEKSFAADPAGLKRLLRAGEEAKRKNLKIAAGLQCRHSVNRQALIERIGAGELGDIQYVRAYRMQRGGRLPQRNVERDPNELQFQIRRAVHFHWASAGLYSELLIHQVDECCWLFNNWPVEAHALGGIEVDRIDCGQNLAVYAIEYVFPNGGRAYVNYRGMPNSHNDFVTYAHGTKRAAQFSGPIHRGDVQIYRDQRCADDNATWKAPPEPNDPWQAEWEVMMDKIRRDEPHNEVERAVATNYAVIMGRCAAHTNRIVTRDEVMASDFRFLPKNITSLDEAPPVTADADGRYPVPTPGAWKEI